MKYETERLILRQWQESDIAPFAEMNSDSEVMKYFPKTLSFEETLEMYDRCKDNKTVLGFIQWKKKSAVNLSDFWFKYSDLHA